MKPMNQGVYEAQEAYPPQSYPGNPSPADHGVYYPTVVVPPYDPLEQSKIDDKNMNLVLLVISSTFLIAGLFFSFMQFYIIGVPLMFSGALGIFMGLSNNGVRSCGLHKGAWIALSCAGCTCICFVFTACCFFAFFICAFVFPVALGSIPVIGTFLMGVFQIKDMNDQMDGLSSGVSSEIH